MSNSAIDALTSPTLKHLREHWWNDEFTAFLRETLRPRPGNRILDVGCGTGTGEISIGRLQLSQIRQYGVDLLVDNVVAARKGTANHNLRAGFAAGDACHLPFDTAAFDSTYCVAVLQHVGDLPAAVAEFARVTKENGRVVVVEPDNSARYWFSSTASGQRVYDVGMRFFAAVGEARGDRTEPAAGPKLPAIFARHGIEPLSVRIFPVAQTLLGAPSDGVWQTRREAIRRQIARAPTPQLAKMGEEYLAALGSYASDASAAGNAFVEIQTTMLFATVGQRTS
jgi:SAM-dependent methyltransferase